MQYFCYGCGKITRGKRCKYCGVRKDVSDIINVIHLSGTGVWKGMTESEKEIIIPIIEKGLDEIREG